MSTSIIVRKDGELTLTTGDEFFDDAFRLFASARNHLAVIAEFTQYTEGVCESCRL